MNIKTNTVTTKTYDINGVTEHEMKLLKLLVGKSTERDSWATSTPDSLRHEIFAALGDAMGR